MKPKEVKRLFLISNMYPSKESVRYGVFVKNFEIAIQNEFEIIKIVLTKKKGTLSKLLGYISLYLKLIRSLPKIKKQDIIFVHFPLHVAPIVKIISLFHKKIILNFHGSDLNFVNFYTKILSLFLTSLIKHSEIVVPSSHLKKKIIRKYNIKNSKVFVYPSGGVNGEVFFNKLKKKDVDFTIGFISSFIKEKGWFVFLEAVNILNKSNVIGKLNIVMAGGGEDFSKIKSLASIYGVQIEFHQELSQERLVEVYNKLDVFIFPSHRESLGLVGLEAMACGVPVISTDIDGPREYVINGYNGFLFELKNSTELSEKILDLYSLTKKEKELMVDNCLTTASNYASITVNIKLNYFLNEFYKN